MDRPPNGKPFDGESGRLAALDEPFVLRSFTRSERGQTSPGVLLPSEVGRHATGLDESVVRVPPGRTGCIVLRREDTFRIRRLQHLGSRHRALSPRGWRELGGNSSQRIARRAPLRPMQPKVMRRSPIQYQGMGERRPSHEGSSDPDQVRELVSRTAVPRSCVRELTGRGGSHDLAASGLGGQRRAALLGKAHQRCSWMAFELPSGGRQRPLESGDRSLSCRAPKWQPQPPE